MAGASLDAINNNSGNLTNKRLDLLLKVYAKTCRSHYLSLTKLWIPSFPAAILSEIATITAGRPEMINKNMCLQHDSSGDSGLSLTYRHQTHAFSLHRKKIHGLLLQQVLCVNLSTQAFV